MEKKRKPRVLIFIVAYNAERTIQEVVRRVPLSLADYDTEILIIDDSSRDETFERARALELAGECPFPITILYNPVNQGYGGNQKIGFHYAIEQGFDIVALVHGDGQYAPERLPDLLEPLVRGEADAVFGSRMMSGFAALQGGMPLYKFVGNKVLTTVQNWLLGSSLSEFHSGYRLYSVEGLKKIPFERNTNDFHFDTEIIIQILLAGLRLQERPIPTFYGDEICHVNGMKYALDVIKATLISKVQPLGIFYDRKYDISRPAELPEARLSFDNPKTLALERIPAGASVADIGAGEHIGSALQARGCKVTEIDLFPGHGDLDVEPPAFPARADSFDYILLLDVLEHLRAPERFLDSLRDSISSGAEVKIVASTANVGFIVTRFALLLGLFNYSRRGILDLTHTRLFTFGTFRKLFEQCGFRVDEIRAIPAPFPLAFGEGWLARIALGLNKAFIHVSRRLFAYQIFIVCRPLPTLQSLLASARETRERKIAGATR
jgi:glycosyltransferase involved in cell wall biosynthesis